MLLVNGIVVYVILLFDDVFVVMVMGVFGVLVFVMLVGVGVGALARVFFVIFVFVCFVLVV